MKNLRGKVVVITGAASGIGRALAIKFAKKGSILALSDINERELQKISWDVRVLGAEVFHQVVDVSSIEQLENFRDNVIQTFGNVDVLINNAGVSLSETVLQAKSDNIQWIFNTNLFGVIHGSRIFLRDLLRQKEARLVNIASIFGVIGVPSQSAYCASKFAVRGFTESLRAELLGSTVKVILVLPGGVKSNIVRNGRHLFDARGNPTDGEFISRTFDTIALTSPEEAADAIVLAVQRPKFRVLIGSDAKLIDFFARIFPSFVNRVSSYIASWGAKKTEPELQQIEQKERNVVG